LCLAVVEFDDVEPTDADRRACSLGQLNDLAPAAPLRQRPIRRFAVLPGMSTICVRREKRRFPVGASPTRRTLQPEATGAVMEVTAIVKAK
jgi:hypothetical protein